MLLPELAPPSSTTAPTITLKCRACDASLPKSRNQQPTVRRTYDPSPSQRIDRAANGGSSRRAGIWMTKLVTVHLCNDNNFGFRLDIAAPFVSPSIRTGRASQRDSHERMLGSHVITNKYLLDWIYLGDKSTMNRRGSFSRFNTRTN